MADRLPAWLFLSISLILLSLAQYPLLRYALGLDSIIVMPPTTMAMLAIGGLMCGLSAMILMVRRQPKITRYQHEGVTNPLIASRIHACGLLLFSGVPLANFLLSYYLWLKHRTHSAAIDRQGVEALNFQISIYLYLLLSAFMVFVVVGLVTTPLILVFYLLSVLAAVIQTARGKSFRYPANIPIIQGRSGQD